MRNNLVRMEDEEIAFRTPGPEVTTRTALGASEPRDGAALPEGVTWKWEKERGSAGATESRWQPQQLELERWEAEEEWRREERRSLLQNRAGEGSSTRKGPPEQTAPPGSSQGTTAADAEEALAAAFRKIEIGRTRTGEAGGEAARGRRSDPAGTRDEGEEHRRGRAGSGGGLGALTGNPSSSQRRLTGRATSQTT